MGWRSGFRRAIFWPRRDSYRSSFVLLSSPIELLEEFVGSCCHSRSKVPGVNPTPGEFLFIRGISSFASGDGGRMHQRPSASNVAEMIEVIAGDGEFGGDMEPRLNQMNVNWTRGLASDVILSLSNRGASAVQFFVWLGKSFPGLRADPGICNLFIDNLGRHGDYGRMKALLMELSRRGQCLTEKAFTFLKLHDCASAAAVDSVRRVVEVLRIAGGSSRSSGIYSLIKFLADLGSFELAIMVIDEMTAPRAAYFNALIAAKCRERDFEDAHKLLDEMRSRGCIPTVQSFNYLLGSLFKSDRFDQACDLLESMEACGCAADALTYEVVIVNAFRVNRVDLAGEFLARMVAEGVRPRLTTHAAFIKGFFRQGRSADARRYIDSVTAVDRSAANVNYGMLASLLQVNGRLAEAAELVMEMMAENLRPNFSVYVRLSKELYRAGHGELAAALKRRFLEFDRREPPSAP